MTGPRTRAVLDGTEPDTTGREPLQHVQVHQAVDVEDGGLVLHHRIDVTDAPEGPFTVSTSLDLGALMRDLGKAAMDSIDDDRESRKQAQAFEMIRFITMARDVLDDLARFEQVPHVRRIKGPLRIALALLDTRQLAMVAPALERLVEAGERMKAAMTASRELPLDPLIEKIEGGVRGLDKLRLKIRKGEEDEEDLDGPGDEEEESISAKFLKLKQDILEKGLFSTDPNFHDLLDQMDTFEEAVEQGNTSIAEEDVDTIRYHIIAAKALLDTCEEVVVYDAITHLLKAGRAIPDNAPVDPPLLITISQVYARLGLIYMGKLAQEGETLNFVTSPEADNFDTDYWTDSNGDPAELVYFGINCSKAGMVLSGFFSDPDILDTLQDFHTELEETFALGLYPDEKVSEKLIELGLTVQE